MAIGAGDLVIISFLKNTLRQIKVKKKKCVSITLCVFAPLPLVKKLKNKMMKQKEKKCHLCFYFDSTAYTVYILKNIK